MAAPSTAYTAADEAALDERLQRLRLRVVQVGLATSGVLFGRACSHQMSTTTQQQRRKRMRLRRLVATYEASLPTFAEGASRIDAIHAALEEHRGMCLAFSTGVCVWCQPASLTGQVNPMWGATTTKQQTVWPPADAATTLVGKAEALSAYTTAMNGMSQQ